jgi:hypothetical protein
MLAGPAPALAQEMIGEGAATSTPVSAEISGAHADSSIARETIAFSCGEYTFQSRHRR